MLVTSGSVPSPNGSLRFTSSREDTEMRIVYIHGAHPPDAGKSEHQFRVGLQRSCLAYGAPSLVGTSQISSIYYADLLDAWSSVQTGGEWEIVPRPSPSSDGEAPLACGCCPPGVAYRAYRALLGWMGHPQWLIKTLTASEIPHASSFGSEVELRNQVRDRLKGELHRLRPEAVIAHSLGTVAVLDALDEMPAGDRPRLLITLGSPLGRPGLFPATTAWLAESRMWWLNVYDGTDEVTGAQAIGRGMAVPVVDYEVNNDHLASAVGQDGGIFTTHSVVHYLSHPVTAHSLAYAGTHPESSREQFRAHIAMYAAPRQPRRGFR